MYANLYAIGITICTLYFIVPSASIVWYGKCVRYCRPDVPPEMHGYDQKCVKDTYGDCAYCKFHPCPKFEKCGNGQVPEPDRHSRCFVCPKECVYAGETYPEGETGISSMDRVNTCSCRDGGFVECSKRYPDPDHYFFCEY